MQQGTNRNYRSTPDKCSHSFFLLEPYRKCSPSLFMVSKCLLLCLFLNNKMIDFLLLFSIKWNGIYHEMIVFLFFALKVWFFQSARNILFIVYKHVLFKQQFLFGSSFLFSQNNWYQLGETSNEIKTHI